MSDTKLGTLLVGNETRDAIHVAIAPVTAGEKLHPGDHVGLLPDGRISSVAKPHIGIVDPFLTHRVMEGERCYLCLYQQTVTGMRHHWAHPSFTDKDTNEHPSKEWLKNYAEKLGITYAELMEGGRNKDLCFGSENYDQFKEEFWTHYAAVTGETGSGNFFRCAC